MASKVKPSHDDSGLQIIKREEFSDDEDDDDFEYQKVEDTFPEDEDEDDELTEALASMQTRNRNQSPTAQLNQATTITQIRPSVVDDFIRNFMIKDGMKRSLETFNAEWYEKITAFVKVSLTFVFCFFTHFFYPFWFFTHFLNNFEPKRSKH